MQIGDILTAEEPPHNRDAPRLCKMCRHLRSQHLFEEQKKAQEDWNNRPPRQKFHDWLVNLSRFGEDQMAIIMDIMLFAASFGMIVPAKHVAKWLLKKGV